MDKSEIESYVNSKVNSEKSLVQVVYEVHEELFDKQDNSGIACKRACSLCCNQQAACTSIEWKEVEKFLTKNNMWNKIRKRNSKTLKKWQKYKIDNWNEIMKDHYKPFRDWLGLKPCLFLSKEGVCEIYEARPMLCRTFTSSVKCLDHNQEGAINFRYEFQEILINMLLRTGVSMTFIDQFLGLKETK